MSSLGVELMTDQIDLHLQPVRREEFRASAQVSARHGGREYPPRRTITADVAELLLNARLARGWSLREAARRIGVTHGTVRHLEAARRAPSLIVAEALIDAYDLDADDADQLLGQAVDSAGKSSPLKLAR